MSGEVKGVGMGSVERGGGSEADGEFGLIAENEVGRFYAVSVAADL